MNTTCSWIKITDSWTAFTRAAQVFMHHCFWSICCENTACKLECRKEVVSPPPFRETFRWLSHTTTLWCSLGRTNGQCKVSCAAILLQLGSLITRAYTDGFTTASASELKDEPVVTWSKLSNVASKSSNTSVVDSFGSLLMPDEIRAGGKTGSFNSPPLETGKYGLHWLLAHATTYHSWSHPVCRGCILSHAAWNIEQPKDETHRHDCTLTPFESSWCDTRVPTCLQIQCLSPRDSLNMWTLVCATWVWFLDQRSEDSPTAQQHSKPSTGFRWCQSSDCWCTWRRRSWHKRDLF